jgi:hypothetical protein
MFVFEGGTLMLWNVCQSVVEPVGATHLTSATNGGKSALNKTAWLEDGRKVLVGDSRYVKREI